MIVGIHQPYFFPYIGYFQLINAVDEFIVFDNVQYSKKGFINRNRILSNDSDRIITLPIKKESGFLDVVEREIAQSWFKEKYKLLNLLIRSYQKAPYYEECIGVIKECVTQDETNLFKFIYNTLRKLCDYLEIDTKILVSSTIPADHTLKAQDRILDICKVRKATIYINAIGGIDLYDKTIFKENEIDLFFIKSKSIEYKQFNNDFKPWLSIIDVMMFNSKEQITKYLNFYFSLQ